MQQIFSGLAVGLVVAVVAIFCRWCEFSVVPLSFAVMLTIPAVIAGVAVALQITGTTLNIESPIGAIMAIGVAVANAILLVMFASVTGLMELRAEAAVTGAEVGSRPIPHYKRTPPMAIGLGERGLKTAPLVGRDWWPCRRDHRYTDHPSCGLCHCAAGEHAKERFIITVRPTQ